MDKIISFLFKNSVPGKTKFYQLIRSTGLKNTVTFRCKHDFKLSLSPFNYVDRIIMKEGFYENEVFEAIVDRINTEKEVFWDIGANMGIHSLGIKWLMPSVEVYAFEPAPEMLQIIMKNEKLNKIKLNKVSSPLSDANQLLKLHLMSGNPGMNTIVPWKEATYSDSILTSTVTGDKLVNSRSLRQPTVIKIDTEGSEYNILKGCHNILSDPALHTVIFEGDNEALDDNENAVVNLLRRHNFTMSKLNRQEAAADHQLSNFIGIR